MGENRDGALRLFPVNFAVSNPLPKSIAIIGAESVRRRY